MEDGFCISASSLECKMRGASGPSSAALPSGAGHLSRRVHRPGSWLPGLDALARGWGTRARGLPVGRSGRGWRAGAPRAGVPCAFACPASCVYTGLEH